MLGSLEVTDTSVPFFRDFWPSLATGTYDASSSTYTKLTSAIFKYADDFVSIVEKHTPPGGSMAEQFSRNDGMPLSASNLTWCKSPIPAIHLIVNALVEGFVQPMPLF